MHILILPLSLFFSGCRRDQGIRGPGLHHGGWKSRLTLRHARGCIWQFLVTACLADPRVQIVLSEGSGPSGRSGPREPHLQDQGACSSATVRRAPGQSGLCVAWGLWAQDCDGAPGNHLFLGGRLREQPVAHKAPDSENSDSIQASRQRTTEMVGGLCWCLGACWSEEG